VDSEVFPAEPTPQQALSQRILTQLEFDKPAHLDHLIEVLDGQSSSEIIAALFELELLGQIKQLPGKLYLRAWQ
jgi:DNA processing protein